jgi:hypothetical protein
LQHKLSQVKTASETKQKLNDLLSLLDDELEEPSKIDKKD